jgi:hypothetical protein
MNEFIGVLLQLHTWSKVFNTSSIQLLPNSLRLTASQLRLKVSHIILLVCKLLYLLGNTMNLEELVVSRILLLNSSLSLSLSLTLQPTVSGPVCLGTKHPSGAYDQIFIIVRQLRVCWCGALSLTKRRVWRLELLLALASAFILWSESRGTRNFILLSEIQDFPFRRLLRLSGLRCRYSTPPPHWISLSWFCISA